MRRLLLLISMLFMASNTYSQEEVLTFEYKKGEILDILLVNRVPDTSDLYARYRSTALPVAAEYSFELMSVLSSDEILLGTPSLTTFIFGKWDNIERRESFLADIVTHVPDFHEQRGDVFSYFVLTYYELPEATTFEINRSKFNVANSFWNDDDAARNEFEDEWRDAIIAHGGKVVLKLENGISPTGYYYNPDSFYIIEWDNEFQFQKFAKNYKMADYEVLKKIHQFSIN